MIPTLAQLEQELEALKERHRVTTALVEALRAYEKTPPVVALPQSSMRTRSSSRPSPAMEATEKVAASLMEVIGGPVQTSQVFDEMKDQGLEVPEKNPLNVISARLSNNTRFKGRRGKGYWFSDRPWPGDIALEFDDDIEEPLLKDATDDRDDKEALDDDI